MTKNFFIMASVFKTKINKEIKILILSFLFIFSTFVHTNLFAQARLGFKASDIRQEFKDPDYQLESGFTSDNIYYITITTSRATVIYYFNEEWICDVCIIIPDDEGSLNYYVEYYNNHYVIISETKWKMYSKEGISNIELVFTEDLGYFFMWY